MSTLKVTLTNGDVKEFPFHSGSQLSVTTPDGENPPKVGSWGEVESVETVSKKPKRAARHEAAE